jgi:hypothetical protein
MPFSVKWSVPLLAAFAALFAVEYAISKHASLSAAPLLHASPRPNKDDKSYPTITPSSFGFQCGTALPTNCPNETWPTTIAQPGMIRLWASQVQWHSLNSGPGAYRWSTLDGYLDAIASHQPRDVMYTFGFTPCWDSREECEITWGSVDPPSDLTPKGSSSFNAFVSALVDHCSPAGHCVKDSIKYWEMWNEANGAAFWSGTIPQLYELMAPAIPIIRNKVPGALILTPPPNRGDTDWMRGWLAEENKRGRLSDIFAFHVYLQGQLPEIRFKIIKDMADLKNDTSGWSNTPWMDTETNFDAANFTCNGRYSHDECVGQLVRWHLLHFAYGASNVNWYFFNATIGRNNDYSNAYHTMMEWLVGGHFTAECAPSGTSANGTIVTCPFIQANGHHAMFVWNFGGDNTYVPTDQYSDYKTLSGNSTTINREKPVAIGVKPIMLESAN